MIDLINELNEKVINVIYAATFRHGILDLLTEESFENYTSITDKIKNAYLCLAMNEQYPFLAYISSDLLVFGGKSPLSCSVSGALMLIKPKN